MLMLVVAGAIAYAVQPPHRPGKQLSSEPLALGSESLDECRWAVSSADWARRLARGSSTQDGLDYLFLHQRSTTVVVTKAELAGATGNITLAHILFVPFGGVGNGLDWPFPSGPAWSLNVGLPAHLRFVPQARGAPPEGGQTPWQMVVGVRVTGGDGGYAKGVRLTYISGGHTHHLTTKAHVGVFRTVAQCDAHIS